MPLYRMLSKELGRTGVHLPEIGMGTWNYHAGPEPLRRGLAAGAWFMDTAESYGTERVVAEAIRGVRDRVFLATKISPKHFRRADVLRAADASLRRLQVDHIDLYQLHRPNPRVPLEETMDAMEELVQAGKVRFIGVSNFTVAEMMRAQRALRRYPLVANQVRYNLVDRTAERDVLPYCQAQGITVIAYSPLARGVERLLAGDPTGVLEALARETGKTPAQVALNWCLCKPGVVAIPKGNSVAHILENCGASGWRLTPEQVQRLDTAICFRVRSPLEQFLRRWMPAPATRFVRWLLPRLPRLLQRKLS